MDTMACYIDEKRTKHNSKAGHAIRHVHRKLRKYPSNVSILLQIMAKFNTFNPTGLQNEQS